MEEPMGRSISFKIVSGALLLAFFSASAFADKITPTHSCKQPNRPFKFKTEAEVERYKAQVETYKKCINDFIEEQRQAIQKHKDAADQAITEWNFFVNSGQK
jgi:hypothetical protein